MSGHLSWQQISKCLIGDAAPEEALHARDCASCGAVLRQAEASLAEMRGAVREWSERPTAQAAAALGPVAQAAAAANPDRHLERLLMPASAYAGGSYKTNLFSVLAHAAVVALLLLLSQLKPVQTLMANVTPLFAPPPQPVKLAKGGGGGGAKQPMLRKDQLPKPVPRAFTPPQVVTQPSSIQAPVFLSADVPDASSVAAGAPNGLSAFMGGAGAGGGGGIGNGYGGGIGNGKGNGVGNGSGGGTGGGMRIGNGVSPPKPIFTPEPEYSEEARKAKFQGTVLLSIVVDETGKATEIKVSRPLGLGLDEKAIEAVKKWKFEPGRYNGKAVAVQATVEVSFRLL
jgi:TonB family protein